MHYFAFKPNFQCPFCKLVVGEDKTVVQNNSPQWRAQEARESNLTAVQKKRAKKDKANRKRQERRRRAEREKMDAYRERFRAVSS